MEVGETGIGRVSSPSPLSLPGTTPGAAHSGRGRAAWLPDRRGGSDGVLPRRHRSFPGMSDLGPLDVALMPVWGWGPSSGTATSTPTGAALALRLLRPRLAVPIHWGTLYPVGLRRVRPRALSEPPLEFARQAQAIAPDVVVRVLNPGEELRWIRTRPTQGRFVEPSGCGPTRCLGGGATACPLGAGGGGILGDGWPDPGIRPAELSRGAPLHRPHRPVQRSYLAALDPCRPAADRAQFRTRLAGPQRPDRLLVDRDRRRLHAGLLERAGCRLRPFHHPDGADARAQFRRRRSAVADRPPPRSARPQVEPHRMCLG